MSGPMVSTRNTLEAKKRKDAAVTKGIHIEESISAKFPARPDVRAFKLLFVNPWLLCFGSNMICLPNCPKFNFVKYSYCQQNDTLILEELVGDRLEEEEEQRGETLAVEEQEVSCWG